MNTQLWMDMKIVVVADAHAVRTEKIPITHSHLEWNYEILKKFWREIS